MLKKVVLLLVAFFCLAVNIYAAKGRFTLVIDAGHGGHDTGALGAKSKEKDINLKVALAFGRYVEKNMPDVFIPLMERANIANKANADLFISVHTNALPAGKIARGFETYTLGMHRAKDNLDVAMRENSVISMEKGYQQTYQGFDPKSSESYIIFEFIQGKNMERSVELARSIQNCVCNKANRPDKGVHQAGFLVLRETSMPSCLIELGFITTPDEEDALNDESRASQIAEAIYEGFAKYKNKYDKGVSVPYRTTSASEQQDIQVKKVADDAPVFKVQILVSNRTLSKGDAHFKGESEFDSYQESGMVKYTIGASSNYNEIYKLRISLLEKFPEAFIIAFKDGQKCDVNQAIREFKQNKQ